MGNYVTTTEVRNEGVPAAIIDPLIDAAILLWEQFIERACRQWFNPRTKTIDMDGNDADILHLPMAVISVTSLFVNGDFALALPTTSFKVYNGREPPNDDRYNPRIKLQSQLSIFNPPLHVLRSVFAKGKQNQRIVGSFGFTEPDGSTPLLIKRAVKKLVIRDLVNQFGTTTGLWQAVTGGVSAPVGPKTFEMTDGHSVQYASAVKALNRAGLSGITGDPEVDAILVMYRAPISIAVPSSSAFFQG